MQYENTFFDSVISRDIQFKPFHKQFIKNTPQLQQTVIVWELIF